MKNVPPRSTPELKALIIKLCHLLNKLDEDIDNIKRQEICLRSTESLTET
jgi:hypothetical protein